MVAVLDTRKVSSGTTRVLILVLGAVLLLPGGARADDGFQISTPRNPYAKLFASGEVLAPRILMPEGRFYPMEMRKPNTEPGRSRTKSI
jgi:hypothetical protein